MIIADISVFQDNHTHFKNNFLVPRVPVLIKNGVSQFPKLQQWTAEYIVEKFPNVTCTYANDSRPVRSQTSTTYADFFENKVDTFYTFTRTKYDHSTPDADLSFFIKDFQFPNPLFPKTDIDKHIFFAGPAKTGALPHEHGDALNFLITGEKRWVMFDASTPIGSVYQRDYYARYPSKHHSLDWFDREYEKLKSDNRVKLYECVQKNNDILYIPQKFSHTTLNNTQVMGIVIELQK